MRVYCGQLAGGGVVDEDEDEGNAMVDGDEVVFEEEVGADEEVRAGAGADADVDVEEERMEEREGEGVVLDAMVIRSVTIYFRW